MRLQGQATGEWPDLTARGTLDVRDVQYQQYALDALRLTYEASDLGAQPHATTQLRLQRARLGTVPLAQVELQEHTTARHARSDSRSTWTNLLATV